MITLNKTASIKHENKGETFDFISEILKREVGKMNLDSKVKICEATNFFRGLIKTAGTIKNGKPFSYDETERFEQIMAFAGYFYKNKGFQVQKK